MSVLLAAPRTSLGSIRSALTSPRTAPKRAAVSAPRPAAARPRQRAAAASRHGEAAPAPLRLTRRGRFLLVGAPILLGGAALLTFVGFFTAPAFASGGSGELTRTQQVSVSTGDSLWSLATEYAPERDPRAVVADIMELNNLSQATVPAGVQLYIPVAG